ncbi:uncharacterized protein KY384_004030 [Bacidia gigantensis]|uniref:uncharacterized protein n=1 Tax=Bacidia gigantensis TaxID=2732470 RepID=UPI001D0374A1|nr:uncharacterized protein KY384_004030 [Bacidia gigantensis]KAG8530675.1 hypothetical protein KY384_004030 [Bacidia gigantensis]
MIVHSRTQSVVVFTFAFLVVLYLTWHHKDKLSCGLRVLRKSSDCRGRSGSDIPGAATELQSESEDLNDGQKVFASDDDLGSPKIIQCSMSWGDMAHVYPNALETHSKHGKRWGYRTHHFGHKIVHAEKAQSENFNRLYYIQSIMLQELRKPPILRAAWVVWYDADTILLNTEIPWETFLPPKDALFSNINMLVTKDGEDFTDGIFFIRVCEWSLEAISSAIAFPNLQPQEYITLATGGGSTLQWAFDRPHFRKHRMYQPQHWWNEHEHVHKQPTNDSAEDESETESVMKGVINMHFPQKQANREKSVEWWLTELQQSPKEFVIALDDTKYEKEIDDFWSLLKKAEETLKWSNKANARMKKKFNVQATPNLVREAEEALQEAIYEEAYDGEKVQFRINALKETSKAAEKEAMDSKHDLTNFLPDDKQEGTEEGKDEKSDDAAKESEEEGGGARFGTSPPKLDQQDQRKGINGTLEARRL